MNFDEDKTINRIPGSISDWFSSLPPDRPLQHYMVPTGDEQDRIKDDLQAILEPVDGAHEARMKLSENADGSFRIEAVEPEETREVE